MFCPRCARQVSEGQRYCGFCANPLDASAIASMRDNPPSAKPAPAAERFFLQNLNGVSVSNLRFVTTGVTYAMANVSSVRLQARGPDRGAPGFMLLVFLIWMAVAARPPMSGSVYVAGAGFVACLVWLALQKTHFVIRVQGGGGESDALDSTDRAFVQQVVGALEQAIIARG